MAEKGDAKAQCELAKSLLLGRGGVPKDEIEAARWYRKSAEQGNAEAQLLFGDFCLLGRGGLPKKDPVEAARWYEQSAEQGQAIAQYKLYLMHVEGHGVKPDATKAMQRLHQSAEQEYALAVRILARRYFLGDGVPKDSAKAARLYRVLAEQGEAEAQGFLAQIYAAGGDYAQALVWANKAAEQGFAPAHYHLGVIYVQGHGLPKDRTKAADHFRKAVQAAETAIQKLIAQGASEADVAREVRVKTGAQEALDNVLRNSAIKAEEDKVDRVLEPLRRGIVK